MANQEKFHHQNGVDRPTLHTHKELRGMHGDYAYREFVIQNHENLVALGKLASLLRVVIRLLTPDGFVEKPQSSEDSVEE